MGRKPIDMLHPLPRAPVLKDSYGIIVYQEQVMQIAQILAGYSLGRGRSAAPGHGQEEERGDGPAARSVPLRRLGAQGRASPS